MTTPEIEELKSLVEKQYGHVLATTSDFENFSLILCKQMKESVSASTLKRLYGYVGDSHKPRMTTLDALSRYIGFESYSRFVSWLKTSNRYNSSFFCAEQLLSSDMNVDDRLRIGWSPNRILTLLYHGNSKYEVVDAVNSKLRQGDQFVTGCFIKGQPLYLPYIKRFDELTAPFVAGRNGGLTIIEKLK